MNTMNGKDAFFALDTTFEDDIASIGEENTLRAIRYINSTPKLYEYIKGNKQYGMSVEDSAVDWANKHNQEFGDLFITELETVDWSKVESRV